jgi:hypothetical protein
MTSQPNKTTLTILNTRMTSRGEVTIREDVAEAIDSKEALPQTNLISTDPSSPLPPQTTSNRNLCRRHNLKMRLSRCELSLIKTLLSQLPRTDYSLDQLGVEARSTSHHHTGTIYRIKSHLTSSLEQPSSWWWMIIRIQNQTLGEVNTTLTLSNSIEIPVRQVPYLVHQRAHTQQTKCKAILIKNSRL